ncbi:osteoclast-associated immunoglobulin-like receptor isoform X2 [Moschus berezovskii]|uniref:osteoclast-associated immunoglobulin-like receptor isoform X2 n=1 Tax=Moschus berezovskii TaxID=68408 RepID=UPI00244416EC|nr:osteoclast-associated immunoglobulin-like receptor isoform X2 [Moschus berezovskii]
MAGVLSLQLLTLWLVCHAEATPAGCFQRLPSHSSLQCASQCELFMFMSAELTAVIHWDASSELAEFFLEEVTPAQGGSYHCCYWRRGWGPDGWSHPSDVLELLVTDELPRPSLVALPAPVVAPGANVSLRCAGRLRGMSFALYREGEAAPLQYRDAEQPWADFPLLGARAPGTYSCYYHTPSAPYVLSARSEPLVVRADGERPALRPTPGGAGPRPLRPRPGGPDRTPAPPDPGARPPPLLLGPGGRSPAPTQPLQG